MDEKIIGRVDSVKTTKDQCVRIVIDIDKGKAPPDAIMWQGCEVELKLVPFLSNVA